MPLYEYKCHSCGTVFEVKQRVSDEPLTVHENCGGTLERLISVSALQFKGSGWYVTDYARPSQGKSQAKADKNGSGKETPKTSDSSKTESSSTKTSSSEK